MTYFGLPFDHDHAFAPLARAKDDLPDGDEIPEPPKTDPIPEDEVPADVPEPEGD